MNIVHRLPITIKTQKQKNRIRASTEIVIHYYFKIPTFGFLRHVAVHSAIYRDCRFR